MSELSEPISAFLDHLQYERRLSSHTVNAYRRDLSKVAAFVEKQGLNNFRQLTFVQARAFPVFLHRSELSSRSIQRVLSAARQFYYYLLNERRVSKDDLYRERKLSNNPFVGVIPHKLEKRVLPNTLSLAELESLLEIDTSGGDIACRDRAILELFYSSGLRLSELTGLDLIDINRDERARKQIVAATRHAGITGRGVPGAENVVVRLRVIGPRNPHLPPTVHSRIERWPCLNAGRILVHGNRVRSPLQLPGGGVKRLEESGRIKIIAGTNEQVVTDDNGCHRREILFLEARDLGVPLLFTCSGVK